MKFLCLFFILISLNLYCQDNSSLHKFQFYNNGVIENSKSIKISVIVEKDTLNCAIKNGQINLPKTKVKCAVLINIKKKNYRIDNVDFSNVNNGTNVLFGIERNLDNFTQISSDYPNLYLIKKTQNTIEVENFDLAKEICFINFFSKVVNGKEMTLRTYNKTAITKRKNGT